ncbi:hypothetical protein [Psychrobacillus sp.]|uniref:hemoblobin-interacting domain-containing protein n=1 Tax=Psychrobacillus sp. TaxID=1871623 RepID=UPI0028BEC514|nr:hypothetical protein [Psychrobacillus sp.]
MKSKLWKEIIVAVLLVSTILSFSPTAYGETTSVQQSIDTVKMEMKQAALAYVNPALKGNLVPSSSLDAVLNSVKKNYEATKKLILVSNLSEQEKQAKLKELEALYQEKIVKGLIPYIDAYNYATKYLDPLLKEIKKAEAKNDFLAVEKAYHKLSVQLKSRTSILYRFSGKAARDLLLDKYKKPADAKRDELIIPVTIIMKATTAQQLLLAGKKEEAQKAIEEIQALAAKLSSTLPFHLALLKELERLQAIVFPAPLPPVVSTPPSTGGGDSSGSSETSAQRALRLAKEDAIAKLTNYKETDYSSANWTTILSLKKTGTNAIKSAKTTTDVTIALDDAKAEIAKVLTIVQEIALDKAKADAIAVLASYKSADYSPKNWEKIEGVKGNVLTAINASKTIAAVNQALINAQKEIDLVNTLVQDQDLVKAEAAKIQSTFVARNPVGTVSLPKVGADYTISVKSTTSDISYDMNGKIQADGTSEVVYTVTHIASGKTADTVTVTVTVTVTILKVPPVLNASVEGQVNYFPNYVFTFIDNPDWRNNITSIQVLSSRNEFAEFTESNYVTSEGELRTKNFKIIGTDTWVLTVKAIGYEDSFVTMVLK